MDIAEPLNVLLIDPDLGRHEALTALIGEIGHRVVTRPAEAAVMLIVGSDDDINRRYVAQALGDAFVPALFVFDTPEQITGFDTRLPVDFTLWPCAAPELRARLTRLVTLAPPKRLDFTDRSVDLVSGLVSHDDGSGETLSDQELRVLRYLTLLYQHPVSREELLEAAWDEPTSPLTRAADFVMLRLRRKLEIEPGTPEYLQTVHGTGYSLILPSASPRLASMTDIMPFAGRDDALARLDELVGRAGLVTVTGPAGIGKSRLVEVHFDRMEHLAVGRQGAILRCDLLSVRTEMDVMARLALRAGFELTGAHDEATLLARVRRALDAEGFSVIVLDDAAGEPGIRAAIASLLDVESRTIVVTSRAPLGLPGEVVLPLEPLTPTAARDLLRQLVEATGGDMPDGDALEALIERAGGSPLELEIEAARLDRGRSPVADGAALPAIWETLGPEEIDALRACCGFDHPYTLEAALQVLVTAERPLNALELLAERELIAIQTDGIEQRFSVNSTVRAFVRERTDAFEFSDLRARVVRAVLKNCNDLLSTVRTSLDPAYLRALDANLIAVHDAMSWAFENEVELVVDCLEVLAEHANFTDSGARLLGLLRRMEPRWSSCPPPIRACIEIQLARLLVASSALEDAHRHAAAAEASAAHRSPDDLARARWYRALVETLLDQRDPGQLTGELIALTPPPAWAARCLYDGYRVLLCKGRGEKARATLTRARRAAQDADDRATELLCQAEHGWWQIPLDPRGAIITLEAVADTPGAHRVSSHIARTGLALLALTLDQANAERDMRSPEPWSGSLSPLSDHRTCHPVVTALVELARRDFEDARTTLARPTPEELHVMLPLARAWIHRLQSALRVATPVDDDRPFDDRLTARWVRWLRRADAHSARELAGVLNEPGAPLTADPFRSAILAMARRGLTPADAEGTDRRD